MRLAKSITDTLQKTEFAPHELDRAYAFVLQNLQSSLAKNELDNLLNKINIWIDEGGSIEFITK